MSHEMSHRMRFEAFWASIRHKRLVTERFRASPARRSGVVFQTAGGSGVCRRHHAMSHDMSHLMLHRMRCGTVSDTSCDISYHTACLYFGFWGTFQGRTTGALLPGDTVCDMVYDTTCDTACRILCNVARKAYAVRHPMSHRMRCGTRCDTPCDGPGTRPTLYSVRECLRDVRAERSARVLRSFAGISLL